jgi:hypothetical protein
MAELYLYFPPGLTLARDQLEDEIQTFLGERGEVTGNGSGAAGSNVDIAIADDADVDAIVHGLSELLRSLGLPPGTRLSRPKEGRHEQIT